MNSIKRFMFSASVVMLALAAVADARAANADIDVENLPRIPYKDIVFRRYAEQNWAEIDPAVVLSARSSNYTEVCFEGKFESFVGALGLKLTGVDGGILFEDKGKRKAAPDLKSLDNVWICGNLQASKSGRGQDLLIYDIAKLPPDAQRFEARFLVLEGKGDAPGLIELGSRIDSNLKNARNLGGMVGFEKMSTLRDKCWKTAIDIKEKAMRPDDANGCYEIALLYRDLIKRPSSFRQWVMKTLAINPDHANAGKDAEAFGMVRVGDTWIPKQEQKDRSDQLLRETERAVLEEKSRLKMRAERLEKEVAERTVKLLFFQAALRTNDPAARVGALTSLGDEIKICVDQNFGLAAVEILTNINDDAAILPGLDRASKSEHREVRQLVYTSLAWRASLNDSASQSAYDVLGGALKAEKEKEPAQSASSALAEIGGRHAIATMVSGLDSNESAVTDALIEGLKKATQQNFQQKDQWQQWWNANKERYKAKAFDNAGVK